MKFVVLEGPSRRMSALDAAFLYFEKPHAPLAIGCVAVVDGPVSRAELLHHLDTHLAGIERFSQRAQPAPFSVAHPAWLPDRSFDLRNHVHRVGVPRPGGDRELCEVVADLIGRPLDRGRPLWEAHLLDGLPDGRTAVLYRVHHCMLDGVAGAGVLDTLLDTESAASGFRAAASGSAGTGLREGLFGRLGLALSDSMAVTWARSRQAWDLLHHPQRLRCGVDPARELSRWALRRVLDEPSALPWSGPIGPRRCLAFSRFPLEQVRAIRAARGGDCSVNDVVLCVLAGGLRRYLESLGIDPERQPLLAAVPASVRTRMQHGALGNRLGMLFVPLVIGPREEPERLDLTAATTRRLKQGQGQDVAAALLAAADLLPPALVAWIGRHGHLPSLAGVIATNVRGPDSPRYLAGRRVEALYPIVPVADGLGLGLAVLSYGGTLHLGLDADADRVPDVEQLRAGIDESMAELLSATRPDWKERSGEEGGLLASRELS